MRNIEWPAEIWYTLKAIFEWTVEFVSIASKVIGVILLLVFAGSLICLMAFIARG